MKNTHQNIYWPIYKNIEAEFDKILYYIHLDDKQLNVYSTKISELILRVCIEIESISKELYYTFNEKEDESKHINFDEALKFLNRKWKIEDKHIIISSHNCYITNKKIAPFQIKEKRTNSNRMTYKWNNAYQNIKHNRYESIEFGNMGNLLLALGSLYILNIYYKDERFYVEDDYNLGKFDLSLGSSIFSTTFHQENSINAEIEYQKKENFDEYLHIVYPDQYLYGLFKDVQRKVNVVRDELIINFLQNNINNGMNEVEIQNLIKNELSDQFENFKRFTIPGIQKYVVEYDKTMRGLKYWLILNKNDL